MKLLIEDTSTNEVHRKKDMEKAIKIIKLGADDTRSPVHEMAKRIMQKKEYKYIFIK